MSAYIVTAVVSFAFGAFVAVAAVWIWEGSAGD